MSPVRHLKDTLPLNAVSKSVLRVATHVLSELLPDVEYFPAYELLMDDLRDYRFYADDMLHSSAVAEDYIWDKFARTYFDADFGQFRKEWAAVRQSLGHRPLHVGAPEHRQFLESTRAQLEQLSLRKVDVAAELRQVHTQLAALPVPRQPETALEIEDDEERIDIGGGVTASSAAEAAPRAAEAGSSADSLVNPSGSRPPRLSPEEFRAQRAARPDSPERGRRDGRGKGQVPQPSENEQFQATTFEAADPVALPLAPVATPLTTAVADTDAAEEAADLADQEAGSKKKRRSRGGAKRTARKNALRLAAEMGSDAAQDDIFTADLHASADSVDASVTAPEGQNARREGHKSSGVAKTQPVGQGGRRGDSGRVSRTELFAAPAPADFATTATPATGVELPVLVPSLTSGELPREEQNALAAQPDAPAGPSRNSRNRNKRKAASALAGAVGETVGRAAPDPENIPAQPVADVVPLPATAEPVARPEDQRGNRRDDRRDNRNQQPLPATALSGSAQVTTAVAAAEAVSASVMVPNPAPAAKRSNRKSRAVSGGRAEKPAVDTPIIPVQDPFNARSQVAAGRMTGSSATLVEAVAMPEPVAVRVAVAKSAVLKTKLTKVPAVPATAAAITPAPAVTPVATVTAPAPAAAVAAAKTKAPATKIKAAVPAKPTKPAPKATVAQPRNPVAVAKAVVTKPVAKPATANSSPKTAAKSVAAAPKAAPAPKETPAAEAPRSSTEGKPTAKAAPKLGAAKPTAAKPAPAKSGGSKPTPATKATAKPAAKPKMPKKATK